MIIRPVWVRLGSTGTNPAHDTRFAALVAGHDQEQVRQRQGLADQRVRGMLGQGRDSGYW
jgi:hypothetical protein